MLQAAPVEQVTESAERGDREAMFELGRRADTTRAPGWEAVAEAWWQRAAEHGHAPSMHALGRLYYDDDFEIDRLVREADGIDEDESYPPGRDPRDWFRKAAGAGHGEAEISLRWLLDTFPCSEEDVAEADDLTRRLAEAGDPQAMHDYGITFEHAADVEPWLRRSAVAGNTQAMVNLAMLLRDHGGADSAAEVDDWLRRAAKFGDPVATRLLEDPDWLS